MGKAAALKCDDYKLEGKALYVNVQGIVHWQEVYSVKQCTLRVQIFLNSSLKLTNQKQPKVSCSICH